MGTHSPGDTADGDLEAGFRRLRNRLLGGLALATTRHDGCCLVEEGLREQAEAEEEAEEGECFVRAASAVFVWAGRASDVGSLKCGNSSRLHGNETQI